MNTQNHTPLARLSSELIDRYGTSPGYRKLSNMALDGRLRTEVVNGKRYVAEADIPALAADLGLIPVHAA